MAAPIPGSGYDKRPISEALSNAWAWVTHHSNSAVDALLAGVPVHCEIGAAAAMSVPLDQIAKGTRQCQVIGMDLDRTGNADYVRPERDEVLAKR